MRRVLALLWLLQLLMLVSGCLVGRDLTPSDGDRVDDGLDPGEEDDSTDPPAPGDDDDTDGGGPLGEGDFFVQLPSDVGGDIGLALRVRHPASDAARYTSGAPVVVDVQGGWSPGNLSAGDSPTDFGSQHGYVSVEVLLPGGSTNDGYASGGTYDVRGPNCTAAIRDALLYAAGEAVDSEGLRLTDRLPFVLTDHVGIIGRSNGGNLVITTLASYPNELSFVKWFAAWESPIGDQYALVELNDNPYYDPDEAPCDLTSCPLPGLADDMHWDPTGQTGLNDGGSGDLTAPGRLRFSNPEVPSSLFSNFPTDGSTPPVAYPTQETAQLLREHQSTLFPAGSPPPWLVTDADAVADFWNSRDGSLRIPEVAEAFPDLAVIHVQTLDDHVQSAPDYPHARSHVNGWIEAGAAFVRCNPDAAYVALVNDEEEELFADNDAGGELPWPGATNWMEPEGVIELMAAAILELADRTEFGDWDANLDAVLTD